MRPNGETAPHVLGSDAALAEVLAILAGQIHGIRLAMMAGSDAKPSHDVAVAAIGRWIEARAAETDAGARAAP